MYTKDEVEIIPQNMMKIELTEFKTQIEMENFCN